MKNFLLFGMAGALLLSGCAAYKASRTPDDVYYSPAKPAVDRIEETKYEDYSSNSEDHYLHMKVRNRYQWDGIDDYSYWNDSRYDFGYSCFPSREVMMNPYYGVSVWNPYYIRPWGAWYSPVSTVVYYKTPKAYYGGNTSKSNLSAYRNNNYYTPNKQSFGSLLKSAFTGNNYNNSSNYNSNNTSRSFSSGTTPSSSAGGHSGGFNSSGSSPSPRPPR